VTRSNDTRIEALSAHVSAYAGDDPLTRLEDETLPPAGPHIIRVVHHPHELALCGIRAVCGSCDARRDWLLINYRRDVWIRCRCSRQ
jgi:hypothetical protein